MDLAGMARAHALNEKQTDADYDDLLALGERVESLEPLRALGDALMFIRPFKSSKTDLVSNLY